jgi:Ser/Thr protein kinase RdoA (MazF antagonist)
MDVLRHWVIGKVVSVDPIPSYWGKAASVTTLDQTSYVLKERGSPSQVEKEYDLLCHLHRRSLPVAVPLLTTARLPFAVHAGRTFALCPRLMGSVVTDHYSPGAEGRATAFGAAIGSLHRALKTYPHAQQFQELRLVEHVSTWAVPTIERHAEHVAVERIRAISDDFEKALSPIYADLPQQLIHRDPNPSNILFTSGRLAGFLDFDMVTRCAKVFDPCYCASSMLVGGWRLPQNRNTWLVLLQALMRGYGLTQTEGRAVFPALLAIQLMFMAFSLDRGQLDAARCNEDVLHWLASKRSALIQT